MNSVIAMAAGRVAWVGNSTSKSGKPYVILRVELSAREYNGRTYRRQLEAHDFQMKETWAVGDWISVAGDAEAKVEQGRDGKTYGKIQIVGRVQRMDVPRAEAAVQEADDAGEPQG